MKRLKHWLSQALVLSIGGSLMGMAIAVGSTLAQPLSSPSPGLNVFDSSSRTPKTRTVTKFTAAHIQYFLDIALGSEFSTTAPKIHKWRDPVRIKYTGNPTTEDLKTLNTVITEVNELTQNQIHLQLVNENPNITLHFALESQFSHYEVNYRPVNYGFFWTQWQNDTIVGANILIATHDVTQKERSHLIREELTQSLGLMQDSWRYPDSLFYQGWTDPTEYTAVDQVLIQMLYDPAIQSGMSRTQVLEVLTRSQTAGVDQPPLHF